MVDILEQYGISCSPVQVEKLKSFKNLVLEKNKVLNLTAITDSEEFDHKHFADSLILLQKIQIPSHAKVIDIGTGAGFPGVPLKIMRSDIQMTLLDSLKKRLVFLDESLSELQLSGISTLHARAEEFGRKIEYREKFDVAISRAVANLNTLAEYDIPFVAVGGLFIAMKGKEGMTECEKARPAIKKLGCEILQIEEYEIFGESRVLIVMKKTKKTDKKYPRAGGKPKKSPL